MNNFTWLTPKKLEAITKIVTNMGKILTIFHILQIIVRLLCALEGLTKKTHHSAVNFMNRNLWFDDALL